MYMKRVNHLFEKIIDDKNLKRAIKEVCKTHRWVHYPTKPNKTVIWIENNLDARVKELKEIISNGFDQHEPNHKVRYDVNAGKQRDIYEPLIWPDQCVHHALIQVLEPVMMRGMDHWCCGSIKGRGAHYGIKQLKKWMKENKDIAWGVEMDIYHFYNSLKPEVVMDRMKHLIKDYRTLDLIWRIIKDGIYIGFYTSQWFANTLLQPLDQAIRTIKIGGKHKGYIKVKYIRYMDNFTILVSRDRHADKVIKLVSKWLKKHDLQLKGNYQKYPTDKRIPNALGYRFGKGYTLLRKKNLLRLKRELAKFYKKRAKRQFISVKSAQGLLSRLGQLRHCNSVHIYATYVKPKTQKYLKNIVRQWQREAQAKWNMYLAAENMAA